MSTLRGSALWGKKEGGSSRGSAFAGKGGRVLVVAAVAASLALVVPGVASSGQKASGAAVPQTLLDAIQANPDGSFSVIIQGDSSEKSDGFAGRLSGELAKDQGLKSPPAKPFGGSLRAAFTSLDGFAATLSGRDILRLAKKKGVLSIVPDAAVTVAGNPQKWPAAVAAGWFDDYYDSSSYPGTRPATIAVVDSGIDSVSGGLGSHLLKQVDLGGGSSSGDP